MPKQSHTIVIDPGHGGTERIGGSSPNNAVGANGVLEKTLTLDIANRVGAVLAGRTNVFLTRPRDMNLGLSDRTKFARDKNADIFLSLHFNGFRDPAVDGTEVWIAKSANQQSRALADTVLRRVLAVSGGRDRGIRQGDLGVILPKNHASHTAACLLEVDFLTNPAQELRLTDDNYKQRLAEAIAAGIRDQIGSGVAAGQSLYDEYIQPLYDTGEHVRTGNNLYPDAFLVGKSPGVRFSYGQIIGMGDLYESVDQMMDADVGELQRLKTLIERNTKYYETNKSDKKLDVSHGEWDKETGGRYLKLADDNYEHFSPNVLFKNAAATPLKRGNNQTTWEYYHERAIEEAQKLFLAPENANRSVFPEWPLIINAFGDHFLTDAFASGHLINKEMMINRFKLNFFNGKSLKPEGKAFFERVAKAAYTEDVKKKFSKLEGKKNIVCTMGWCFVVYPNISNWERFAIVLKEAAEKEPDEIGNVVVKALHDRLNEDGIEVANKAGNQPWKLTGDETLDEKNLNVIQRAVQQSIDNINDPSIRASNLNFGAYFDKVWKHVPQLTPTSHRELEALVNEYTDPKSAKLANKAADLIKKQVDLLAKKMVDTGGLRPK